MKKILLVDDDPVACTALRELLRAEPTWELIEIANGQTALDRLCDGLKPDLCLLDLQLPGLSGLELLQRIRRDPLLRPLRVAIVSGSRDKDQILALAGLQVSAYLLKPFNAVKVLANLRPLLATAGADPLLATHNLLGHTALIVDDSEVDRLALREILHRDLHWETVEARHGEEALERLHGGLRPDLVFLDLRMPGINGLTLLQRVREDPDLRRLKVIILSGEHDREQVIALARLQISGYLLKPVATAKVRAALTQALGPAAVSAH